MDRPCQRRGGRAWTRERTADKAEDKELQELVAEDKELQELVAEDKELQELVAEGFVALQQSWVDCVRHDDCCRLLCDRYAGRPG